VKQAQAVLDKAERQGRDPTTQERQKVEHLLDQADR
jgi:hypothetical protein